MKQQTQTPKNVPFTSLNTPQNVAPVKSATPALQLEVTVADPARIARDTAIIQALLGAGDAAAIKELDALKGLRQYTPGSAKDLLHVPGGLGSSANGHAITPGGPQNSDIPGKDDTGFDDPLAGHGNQRSRGVVVGAPSMPTKGSLVGQDTYYSNGSDSSHSSVWPERHTERSSADGSDTWGSTTYRDYGGNGWRVDYHDERHEDGSITSKDTVFDNAGEPIKTTLREGHADGTATETTTTHETGESTTHTGTMPEIFPDRSQTGEGVEASGSANPAPRGWYNPITGVGQNMGIKTSNNQVNPGREGNEQPTPVAPVKFDKNILVVNPAPDAVLPTAVPKGLRDSPTIVDPPRPE